MIVLCMLAIAFKQLFLPEGGDGRAGWNARNLTFWSEAFALGAFGLGWSVKGRIFNFLRDPDENDPMAVAKAQARAA